MRRQQAIQVDDAAYQRFSDSNTAFNAVSREIGEHWHDRFRQRRLRLVAEGKAAPGDDLTHPEDALFHFGFNAGFGAIEEMTLRYFARDHRGNMFWDAPAGMRTEVSARRCDDAGKLTRQVRPVARRCGAALVGVTRLDPRWVYADARRRRRGASALFGRRF